jgi:hypothetical protein
MSHRRTARCGRVAPRVRSARGVTTAEYAVVLLSLVALWELTPELLEAVKRSFDLFSWTLMIPF